MPAALSDSLERLVGDFFAVCYVEALQAHSVLCQSEHGPVGDGLDVCDIEGEDISVALEHGLQTQVGEFCAVGQRQALNTLAAGERLEGAVADLAAEGGKIQALNEAAVIEEAIEGLDGADDALDV